MQIVERYQNQRLLFKLLIPLFLLIIAVAIGIFIGRDFAFEKATNRAGERRANQEIQIIQHQFDVVQNDLLLSTKWRKITFGQNSSSRFGIFGRN